MFARRHHYFLLMCSLAVNAFAALYLFTNLVVDTAPYGNFDPLRHCPLVPAEHPAAYAETLRRIEERQLQRLVTMRPGMAREDAVLRQLEEAAAYNEQLEMERLRAAQQSLIPPTSPVRQNEPAAQQDDGSEETADALGATELKIGQLIDCVDRDYTAEVLQRGEHWVLKNFLRAEHGRLRCFASVTYTTHADYTFLDNLQPLLARWQAPISIALFTPGADLQPTMQAIRYVRDCGPYSDLVRQYATFHLYFPRGHMPPRLPKASDVVATLFDCENEVSPFANVTSAQLYRSTHNLLYPVNVGRNIARDAAMTHFILASDIELYPNPGLATQFLDMIARNEDEALQSSADRPKSRIWPLVLFEVDADAPVPKNKTHLLQLLEAGRAISFHKRVCASCHGVPKMPEWLHTNQTDTLGVFHVGKRTGQQYHWEPIYIGTHADPHYDERLSWEGKSDKMTQGFALCVLDYEFQILNNAFLVHRPGIKVYHNDVKRNALAEKTNQLIRNVIQKELKLMYGMRKGCSI